TPYQLHCLRQRQTASPSILRGVGALALIAHAISLYGEIFTGQGLSFGFFHVSSLIAWLVIAVTLVFSLREPLTSVLRVLFPVALIAKRLGWRLPDQGAATVPGHSALLVHVLMSILSYGILAMAAFQASLLSLQNRQLGH